jgi:hypothetical protein
MIGRCPEPTTVFVVVPPSLIDAVGTPIRRVRRIHYVYNGRPDTDFGPVELTIGERPFLFDTGADRESLRVTETAWADPFREPLSTENREFVERSGKWTAFDVSALGRWAKLIGEPLSDVEAITDDGGKTTGIVLRTEHGGALRLGVMADELFVDGLVTPD